MERGSLRTRALWQRAISVSRGAARGEGAAGGGGSSLGGTASGAISATAAGSGSGGMLKSRTSFHALASSLVEQKNRYGGGLLAYSLFLSLFISIKENVLLLYMKYFF